MLSASPSSTNNHLIPWAKYFPSRGLSFERELDWIISKTFYIDWFKSKWVKKLNTVQGGNRRIPGDSTFSLAKWNVHMIVTVMCIWYIYLYYVIVLITQLSSLVALMVNHLPTVWQTQVRSVDQEDLQEKEMAPHSSILAWKIPWMEQPGRLQSMGLQRVGHDWATSLSHNYRLAFIQVVSLDHQHQHYLGARWKCRFMGPISDPLNQKHWGCSSTLCVSVTLSPRRLGWLFSNLAAH